MKIQRPWNPFAVDSWAASGSTTTKTIWHELLETLGFKKTPSAWNDPWCWRRVAPSSNNVSIRACFDPITNILHASIEQTHWPQIHTTLIRSVLLGAPSYWFSFTWKGFEACINLHSTLNPMMYKQNNYIWTMVCVLHLISAKLEQLRTFCNNVWNNTYLQRVQGLIWATVYFMTCVCVFYNMW